MAADSLTAVLDQEPDTQSFFDDVIDGLEREQPRLPCKYFYDERGSHLFDQICELDEYYLTRTELAIMESQAPAMAAQIGPGVRLVEFGSGSSIKTRLLLDQLIDPIAYVPVDISLQHLKRSAERLADAYRNIEVLPVCADFTKDFRLPAPSRTESHTAVYFPGSTIGNFEPAAATRILGRIAQLCGHGGGLLIGVDLQKDVATIEAAYNDREGVTAEFNLNMLRRINRELDADFELDHFEHRAVYNRAHGRVEISLICQRDQVVTIGERVFEFTTGQSIGTEHSHKYTIDGIAAVGDQAGLSLHRYWTDTQRLFAVCHLATVD